MSATLPLLRVKTAHSEYLIDQNNGKFSRQTVHEDANDIWNRSSGELRDYHKIVGPVVGESMMVIEPSGAYLRSTPVVSIEEVNE